MKGVFIVGTDTGVGKTILSAALMAAGGPGLVYWKPVQTGAGEGEEDTAVVRRLAAVEETRLLEPGYRFAAPASPHHAAALEGREVSLEFLLATARGHDRPERRWIVEGIGGLLVPFDGRTLLPALIRALGLPVIVASSTRLGTINHTLLTLREIGRQEIRALGIVLVGPPNAGALSGIEDHTRVPVLGHLPPLDPLDRASVRARGETLARVAAIQEALA